MKIEDIYTREDGLVLVKFTDYNGYYHTWAPKIDDLAEIASQICKVEDAKYPTGYGGVYTAAAIIARCAGVTGEKMRKLFKLN